MGLLLGDVTVSPGQNWLVSLTCFRQQLDNVKAVRRSKALME